MIGHTGEWMPSLGVGLNGAILNGTAIIISGTHHGYADVVDYRLRTPAGVTYTKLSVTPAVGTTITFTSSDRDWGIYDISTWNRL